VPTDFAFLFLGAQPPQVQPQHPFLRVPSKQNLFHTVKAVTKPWPEKQHALARETDIENNIGNHPLVGVTALAVCHPVHHMTALLYLNMACICHLQVRTQPPQVQPQHPFLRVPSEQNPFHTVKAVTKPWPEKQHAPARETNIVNNIGNHPLVGVTALAICHPVHHMTALLYLNLACICHLPSVVCLP
jgi:hypothetical protein